VVEAKRVFRLSQIDEESALAVLFGNTKKKKRTVDLLTLAKSCDYLVRKYGSRNEVAKRLELSTEMIREILAPLSLPQEIQNLISERKIDSIDVVREIAAIKDHSKQLQVGNLFTKVPTKDIREIKRLLKESRISVEEATNTVLKFKERDMHVFIIDFDDLAYETIKTQAKKLGLSPAILVKGLIQSWIKGIDAN
jgi:Mg-chelatase subunit ChlI